MVIQVTWDVTSRVHTRGRVLSPTIMSVEDTFAKLCRNEETIQSARAFYRRAKARTGPGSGFDLGTSVAALPAICAYKASQRYYQ